ncbi:glycosyltransferase family 39 protein [Candidatus Woesearchaeota archaeon]|nr:glycosyltransferase family 39 protein [Candidatus Woesearchaeota archaeon]
MLTSKNKLAYVLFFVFGAIFILIALKGLMTLQPGDENVYYYMGKLVNEGKLPYRDFFYAHPPLHIYLIALIYKAFGFNIIALKLVPLISTLVSAFFIFKMAKEKFGSNEAIISSLLFLFSYSTMFNSVFSFGIDAAMMFLVTGLYFLWSKDSYILSGTFFGIAGVTRLLSLIPICIIFASALISNKKNFLKLSSSFLAVFLLVNLTFTAVAGSDYTEQVYKYHLLKSLGSRENFREYSDIIKLNWVLFLSALSFIFIKDKKPINILAIVSVIYLIFLLFLKRLFGFYFIIIFPFLAIIGGYGIIRLFGQLNLIKKWKIIIITILSLIFIWDLAANILFLQKIGFAGFERGNDLIDFINSASNKDTMLFGDDSIVPLLALLTNKKIALDFVDTNNEVFISGIKDLNKELNNLKGKDVLFVIRSKQGISYFSELKDFLNKNCDFLSQFHDKIEGSYLLYRCG